MTVAAGPRKADVVMSSDHSATKAALTVLVAYLVLVFPSMIVNTITVVTDLRDTYLELLFYHHLAGTAQRITV